MADGTRGRDSRSSSSSSPGAKSETSAISDLSPEVVEQFTTGLETWKGTHDSFQNVITTTKATFTQVITNKVSNII